MSLLEQGADLALESLKRLQACSIRCSKASARVEGGVEHFCRGFRCLMTRLWSSELPMGNADIGIWYV